MSIRRLATCSGLAVIMLMTGCAMVNDRAWRLFQSPTDALAIVNGQLLRGKVKLVPDRTGTLTLEAKSGAITNCFGGLRFTSTQAGSMDLRCNDGSSTELQFSLISEARGYAYGQSAQGQVSLTFGLSDNDARAYLKVPEGKKLVEAGKDKVLELQ